MFICQIYQIYNTIMALYSSEKFVSAQYIKNNNNWNLTKFCIHCDIDQIYRHVMINGSPVSLTKNSAVFRKTDFKKKSRILKNPLIVIPFFC